MKGSLHGSLSARVLTLIERHPEGLQLEEVRSRVRADGRRPDADVVAAVLLALQQANLAQISARRRWFSASIPKPRPPDAAGDPESLELAGSSARANAGPWLTAIPTTLGAIRAAPTAPPPLASADEPIQPSWTLLRRLLPYYREALARNERALLLSDPSRHGEQFILLAPRGRWWPGESELAVLEMARSVLPPAFLTALARRRREPIHVAFPIALVRSGDVTRPPFLVPVATVAADWTLDAETLRLMLPAETPAVEWSWVRGQRQRGRRVRELLDALDVSADDEVWHTGSFVDWRTFIERLAGAVPTELRTPLDPVRPLSTLDCGGPGGVYGALGDFQQRPYPHLVPTLRRGNAVRAAPAARDARASRRLRLPRWSVGARLGNFIPGNHLRSLSVERSPVCLPHGPGLAGFDPVDRSGTEPNRVDRLFWRQARVQEPG